MEGGIAEEGYLGPGFCRSRLCRWPWKINRYLGSGAKGEAYKQI